jgi:hypothetical protein
MKESDKKSSENIQNGRFIQKIRYFVKISKSSKQNFHFFARTTKFQDFFRKTIIFDINFI